jgi:antitoxin component YwqK of YwqJK toxin-antitoxin module|tara:strand:+ start:438 stop:851 length:414 start_codon:yes stop_codon:yes gene_type:complete
MHKAAKTVLTKVSDEKTLIERYYSNGQLKYKAYLNEMPKELRDEANGINITPKDYSTRNGWKDGKVTWWCENGQPNEELHYKRGKRHGKWTAWFENGQIKWEKDYKNGKADGKWIWWRKNGQTEIEKNYKNGKLKGD